MQYISFYKHIVMILFIGMLYTAQEEINFYADSWALLIGINEYQFEKPLNYAVADAEEMQRLLVEKLGFPEKNIEILLDDNATLNGIKKSMQKLAENTSENDRVLIYFAGHGMTQPLPSGGEEGYLIPINGKSSDLFSTSIPMSEMQRLSNMTPAKDMLFLMDACYSGLMGVGSRGLDLDVNTPNYLKKISAGGSRTVITAGKKGEIAQERAEWGHSPFVKNIVSGLEKGMADYNSDSYITSAELGMYLKNQVTADTDRLQTPSVSRFTSDLGEFVFIIDKVDVQIENDAEDELSELRKQMKIQQDQLAKLTELMLAQAEQRQLAQG
ncbi:MAG: caspase family protein, partial [Candidatus Marinimicrobia bacterium]|nr:caspase family protein [Candidatus Neomarinimicrobiota bacterium]